MKRTWALALLLLAGCGQASGGTLAVSGDELLPSASGMDWVTYGDVAARVTVVEVNEVPPTEEELKADEGIIGRQAVLKVEDVLWRQKSRTLSLPSEVRVDAGGWMFKGKERRELDFAGAPDLLEGHEYLVVFAFTPLDDGSNSSARWIPLGGGAMVPFDDGEAGRGEESSPDTEFAQSIDGKSGAEVATILGGTKSDPRVSSLLAQDPLTRLRAVQQGGG